MLDQDALTVLGADREGGRRCGRSASQVSVSWGVRFFSSYLETGVYPIVLLVRWGQDDWLSPAVTVGPGISPRPSRYLSTQFNNGHCNLVEGCSGHCQRPGKGRKLSPTAGTHNNPRAVLNHAQS